MTSSVDQYLLPKELKLTTKYTEEQREQVKYLFKQGYAKRKIARTIPMSRRMVDFVLNPDKMKKCKEQYAIRQKEGRYRYPTQKQTEMVRKVRNRKKLLINQLIKK